MARNFGTQRKAKLWAGIPTTLLGLTADNTFLGGSLAFTSPQTVLRMLGEYVIGPASAVVAGDDVEITVALGKVSTDAFALGASAVPDPNGEPEYPWLYWKQHVFTFPTTSGDPSAATGSVRQSYDIKTMRKFTARESLVWVINYGDLGGAPPMTLVLGQTRVLTTLH